MKLSLQRRLAADILGVGVNRVWIDPARVTDVANAITRADVKALIDRGVIRAKLERTPSRGRARERSAKRKRGRRRGAGSRKGPSKARSPKKEGWMRTVRPLRLRLQELRDSGAIGPREYRRLYRMVKGGAFGSKAHLEDYLRKEGLLK